MTAVVVVVAMRNHADMRSDHVDGHEPGRPPPDAHSDADADGEPRA
jgi:multicomponent K+:H+ antiporter subunit C